MSLDSRLRRGLLEIGEGFDPAAAISFPSLLRRGERRARIKRIGIVGGALVALVLAVSAGVIVDAVRSAWRDYNESNDQSKRVLAIAIQGRPAELVAEAGQLWTIVEGGGPTTLVRVEPRGATSTEVAHFEGAVVDLAIGEGHLWVLERGDQTRLLRIDPDSGAIERTVRVGSAHQMTIGAGSVWIAVGRDVLRLDASSLRDRGIVETSRPIERLEAGAGAVWIDPVSGPVMRIEPAANAITQRYLRTDLETLGDTAAWLSRPAGPKLKDVIRVDPSSRQGVAWGAVEKDALLAGTERGAWVVSSTRPGTYSIGHLDKPGVIFATTIPLRGGDLTSPLVVGNTLYVLNRRDLELVAIDVGGLR